MNIVLFRRLYSCKARVSTFWRRNDWSLAIKREAVTQPNVSDPATRSISSQLPQDQPGREGAADEPANILIANAGAEPVELLISQVAQLPKVSNIFAKVNP